MFTRIVELTAKPGRMAELSRTINENVLGVLRNQTGFVDEITLVSDEDPDMMTALSFWNSKGDADRYSREQFPQILELVRNLVEEIPEVRTFYVEQSTIQKIRSTRAA